MRKRTRLGKAWEVGGLGVDAASRRKGRVPEHEDPLFNYIAGTVLPAGYSKQQPEEMRHRRVVKWVFGAIVLIGIVFRFVESPV